MKNGICTKGFINELGDIEVPGVFFEEGAEVDLKIWVERGRFEIALFPSENESKHHDCGISEEEIQRTCAMFDDCGVCPLKEYCESEAKE